MNILKAKDCELDMLLDVLAKHFDANSEGELRAQVTLCVKRLNSFLAAETSSLPVVLSSMLAIVAHLVDRENLLHKLPPDA